MKTIPKMLDKFGITYINVFIYSYPSRQLSTIFMEMCCCFCRTITIITYHLVCWGGEGRHRGKYHSVRHSAFSHQELLRTGAELDAWGKTQRNRKYLLPTTQYTVMKNTGYERLFPNDNFETLFKVSRATILGTYYIRSMQAVSYPLPSKRSLKSDI